MSAQDFLVEIGTEELPPKSLHALANSFTASIQAGLGAAGLSFERDGVRSFATPRRLAVWVPGLAPAQPDRTIEKQGPFVAQAFTQDGVPTPAATGFARGNGVEVDALERVKTDKGERLVFRAMETGRLTIDLLPEVVEQALHALPIPRRMRWGSKRTEFVRPVHWVVMLYGTAVVECEILGLPAGRHTRGHRFHAGPAPVAIPHPADYAPVLREHRVEACPVMRRDRIVAQVEDCARVAGGQAVMDSDLLDEVTSLVEWPVALTGRFEPRFLDVPPEALVSSMREHQKYFHVVDAQGRLLPCFITVSNLESQDPAQVIDGNERVIRPRLTDAAFFYQTDLRQRLVARRERLKSLVFQQQLGSMYDKSERIALLASHIAHLLHADVGLAHRAGELAKADLLSSMVLEFDSMQGIAGSYYALHDGEHAEVATAIREHYLPRFAGDAIAQTVTGRAVAIADRLDTLVGIFGIGQPPTGSKDPFALRRASLGVLVTLVRGGLDLDLANLIAFARAQYPAASFASEVPAQVLDYVLERLRGVCLDEGVASESFQAVHAKGLTNPLDIYRRVQAVHHFAALPEAEALAAANKRVSNLLAKSAGAAEDSVLDLALLQDPAESNLAAALHAASAAVEPLLAKRDYQAALASLAALREPVDAFFDGVMVMVEDAQVRSNRLALLARLRALFLQVADVAQLVPEKHRV